MNLASPDSVPRPYPLLSSEEITAEMNNITMDISKIPFYLPEDSSTFRDAINTLFMEFCLSRPTFTAASTVIDKLCGDLQFAELRGLVITMGPFQNVHYMDVARLCYFLRTRDRTMHSKKTFQM